MGAKLSAIFDEAKALGGVQAVVKLAMLTKVSSPAAATLPDTPENTKLFADALAKLKQQLGK
jgi:hypothetical protein